MKFGDKEYLRGIFKISGSETLSFLLMWYKQHTQYTFHRVQQEDKKIHKMQGDFPVEKIRQSDLLIHPLNMFYVKQTTQKYQHCPVMHLFFIMQFCRHSYE